MLDITTRVDICIGEHLQHVNPAISPPRAATTDRIGLILIGMPGLERQFSRYPQFYSRVGFAHEYRALSCDELRFVLDRHWHRLALNLDPDDFTDSQAVAAIARITRANLSSSSGCSPRSTASCKSNDLDTITDDVIESARSTLVIGVS